MSVQGLELVAREVRAIVGDNNVIVVPTDVSVLVQVQALKDRVLDTWGEVGWTASRLYNDPIPISSLDCPHTMCHRSQFFSTMLASALSVAHIRA